ncbi:MAG: GtrA family protein [Pseudomonadota bacterium]
MDRTKPPDVIGQFLRFGVVGVIGFVVDAGTLAVLLNLGLGLYSGRLVSFLLALTVTWALNRRFTFRDKSPERARQWGRFAVVATLGGAINYGVYAWMVSHLASVAAWPTIGVAAGSLASYLFNFSASRVFVFRCPDGK